MWNTSYQIDYDIEVLNIFFWKFEIGRNIWVALHNKESMYLRLWCLESCKREYKKVCSGHGRKWT
jgi:hypothetical protein